MRVKPCQPYQARLAVPARLLRMADGRSAFKLYFVSILGRSDRARYEWGVGPEQPDDFIARFSGSGEVGVGFVTVFKHIAKIFRFAPAMETVLHVRALRPNDLQPLSLEREDGYCEFACYAEALLAAAEYRAWAKAQTVDEYLSFRADLPDGMITAHAKLAKYCGE